MALIQLFIVAIFTTLASADASTGASRFYKMTWWEDPSSMSAYFPPSKFQSKVIQEDPSTQEITNFSDLTGDRSYCVTYLQMLQFKIPHNEYKLIKCTQTYPITATISAKNASDWMSVCRAEYPSEDYAHLISPVPCR